jgi:hypothetical protein
MSVLRTLLTAFLLGIAAPAAAQQPIDLGVNLGIDSRPGASAGPSMDDFIAGLRFWGAADIWMLGDLRSAIKEVAAPRHDVNIFEIAVPATVLNGPTPLAQAYALSRNNRAAVHDTVAANPTLVQKLAEKGFTANDVELLNFYSGGLVWVYVLKVTD